MVMSGLWMQLPRCGEGDPPLLAMDVSYIAVHIQNWPRIPKIEPCELGAGLL